MSAGVGEKDLVQVDGTQKSLHEIRPGPQREDLGHFPWMQNLLMTSTLKREKTSDDTKMLLWHHFTTLRSVHD